ncbi:DIRP domain [Trinorchestia longiramus]|nr:DIRP domain [Trinorchestia longiramus]
MEQDAKLLLTLKKGRPSCTRKLEGELEEAAEIPKEDEEEEMDLDDVSPLQALGLHRVGQLPPRPPPSLVPVIPLNKRGMPARLRKKNPMYFDETLITSSKSPRGSPRKVPRAESLTPKKSGGASSQSNSPVRPVRTPSAPPPSTLQKEVLDRRVRVADMRELPVVSIKATRSSSRTIKPSARVADRMAATAVVTTPVSSATVRKESPVSSEEEEEEEEEPPSLVDLKLECSSTRGSSSGSSSSSSSSCSGSSPSGAAANISAAAQTSEAVMPSLADRTAAHDNRLRLRNFLKLPQAHKWIYYEWFYANIDQPLFLGRNDFEQVLQEAFPQLKTRMLTRRQWSLVRRIMGKPRRCSEAFFNEELSSLAKRRQVLRLLQQRKISDVTQLRDLPFTLPHHIPCQLVIGTKVHWCCQLVIGTKVHWCCQLIIGTKVHWCCQLVIGTKVHWCCQLVIGTKVHWCCQLVIGTKVHWCCQLVIGTKVTARIRKPENGLYIGHIDAVDTSNNTYRITFVRNGIGTHSIPDYEVLSCEQPEMMPLASFQQKFRPRPPLGLVTPPRPLLPRSVSGDTPIKPPPSLSALDSPPFITNDPILAQSPRVPPAPLALGDIVGQYPVEELLHLVKLWKLLESKAEKVRHLEQLNSGAEKLRCTGETVSGAFQRRYATLVLEVDQLNDQLNSELLQVHHFCQQISGGSSAAAAPTLLPDQIRERCMAESVAVVQVCCGEGVSWCRCVVVVQVCCGGAGVSWCRCVAYTRELTLLVSNSATPESVTNKDSLHLITALTALMLQVKVRGCVCYPPLPSAFPCHALRPSAFPCHALRLRLQCHNCFIFPRFFAWQWSFETSSLVVYQR